MTLCSAIGGVHIVATTPGDTLSDTTATVDQTPKDRPFNPFRQPHSASASRLVADAIQQLQVYEEHLHLRQRKRRAVDQVTFEATVTAIVCDLIHRHLTAPGAMVAVSLSREHLSRRGRYRSPAMNKGLPEVLKRLASPEMALVDMDLGNPGCFSEARLTTLRAGSRLIRWIEASSIAIEDLALAECEEVILLKRPKADLWDKGGLIEYRDTRATRSYRLEVEEINKWLAEADIAFDPAYEPEGRSVDSGDRRLKRYFINGSFEQGGRLFGGFWLPLGKTLRHAALSINGEDVVTLDYAQMAPRIIYGLAGSTPPPGDIYAIPGLARFRPGIKKVFNAITFATKPMSRMPRDTRPLFPDRIHFGEVLGKIRQAHPDIAHLFFTGVGFKAQFIESEIIVDVLLELKALGIVALPVHDAVVVPRSEIAEVTKVMKEVFLRHTGIPGGVEMEE